MTLVNRILKLTHDFYQSNAQTFNATRQYPWKGWGKVLDLLQEYASKTKSLSVCDLGCGNGRFYKYLDSGLNKGARALLEYTGHDISSKLLEYARSSCANSKARFIEQDAISKVTDIKDKYDVVVAFGLTHHIPPQILTPWINDIIHLLKPGGILVLTFWNFDQAKATKLDTRTHNEFMKGWQNTQAKRYCYYYTKEELAGITKIANLTLLDTYESDGKTGTSNTYQIYMVVA